MAISGLTTVSNLDLAKAAYDRMARFALRPELYFDQVADIRPTNQSMPGASVTFPIISDLAIASNPITENTDITPQTISESNVTVTLNEYGNAVLTSAKLRAESYVEIDPIVANVIGYNAGVSMDEVARDVLKQGTNVAYTASGGTRATTAATDKVTSSALRGQLAALRSANVPNFNGFYTCYIHPNVSYDLRSETGAAAWRDPHVYSQPGEIWAGELGAYEGFRFIETPRGPVFPGAGSGGSTITLTTASGSTTATFTAPSTNEYDKGNPQVGSIVTPVSSSVTVGTTIVDIQIVGTAGTATLSAAALTTGTATVSKSGADVFGTLIVGRQSLAKAWSVADGNTEQPHVVPGPITDFLRRFVPWGWYWIGGYGIYRQDAVRRLETGSSLTYSDPAIDQ